MYLNTNYIHNKGFTLNDIYTLQVIHQNRTENMESVIATYITDDMLDKFVEKGFVSFIKGGKKDSKFKLIRLSKKGSDFLDNCYTPEITEGDVDMFNYLSSMYLSHEDKERKIGNKKKTKIYCAVFRKNLSLSLHEMYWLCWAFLQDYKYTKVLEYIFFNSNKQRYGKFENNIEESPLFQYFDENKEKIQRLWEKKIKK